MKSPQENFDSIQRLLALKRHEQPPPGYFNYFSDKVISRIEVEQFENSPGWWARFVSRFDAKPVLACAYGFTISGLLLMGFRLSEIFEQEAATAPTRAPSSPWLAAGLGSGGDSAEFVHTGYDRPSSLASFSSLYPIIQSQPVGGNSSFRIQPASFSFAH